MARKPKPKLKKREKEQILELARQGYDAVTVSRQLNLDGQQVNGYISTCRNHGLLPGGQPPPPEPPSGGASMQQSTQPAPQTQPPDDFTGGRPIVGGSDGWSNPAQNVKYVVERIVPPDGLLGTHYGSFSKQQLGEIYGEGQYKVQRFEPGKPLPVEHVERVSASYGQPKFPNRANDRAQQQQQPPSRSAYRYSRPWDRSGGEGDDYSRYYGSYWGPYYRNMAAQQQPAQAQQPAAPPSGTGDATVAEMVRAMGTMHTKSLEQMEKSRSGGPDQFLTTFFHEQNQVMNARFAEERQRAEDRRKAEEEKWERLRGEDQRRTEERQTEERTRAEQSRKDEHERHEREISRIKAEAEVRQKEQSEERKFLLELEDKKLKLMQEEARIQRERLEGELKGARADMLALQERTSSQMRELQERTSKEMSEHRESMEGELEREREQLEREYKLREKGLDKEHSLNEKILDVKKEAAENQGGDALFTMIQTLVKEASKGLEKLVDLKKIQAMSPEAQAAAVSRGSLDGNIVGAGGRPAEVPTRTIDSEPAPSPATTVEAGAAPNGNGHGPEPSAEEQAAGETRMDEIIQQMLGKPFFKQVLNEWALHVESGEDATTFANLYLEWMRDPRDDEGRKACAAFATYMRPRKWERMFKVLEPHLEEDVKAVFQTEGAESFYEVFRTCVIEQIKDYWEQFLEARNKKRTGAGRTPASEPTPEPAEASGEPPPVPTRETPPAGQGSAAPPPVPTRGALQGS